MWSNMKKAIAYGAELGARKMLLCPGNGYSNEARERIWERCRTSIIELTKTAEQYDVMLVLETQAQEDSIFMNTVWDQKEMLDQIAHPLFKAMIDTVQLAQFDSSVAENMGILGTENVRHVHLGIRLSEIKRGMRVNFGRIIVWKSVVVDDWFR